MLAFWRSRILLLVLASFVILANTGCQRLLAPEPTPTPLISLIGPARGMEAVKCPFSVPQGVQVTCGKLEAPEDYAELEGDKIKLFTAIIHSPNTAAASDAVVLLPQNAGISLTDSISYIGRQLAGLLEDRDLVYYEYRGLGQSDVDLNCPEYYDAYLQTWLEALNPDEEAALYTPALETCKERMFNAQVDPTLFTIDEMAADLNLLRLALGYSQFDLLAGGYGSELALVMARDYPQAVRSVALFEPAFPKAYRTAEMHAISLQQSLNLLFNRCTADEKCRLAYPELEQRLYSTVDQLNTRPAEIKLFFPGENSLTTVQVSGYDFLMLLRNMLLYRSTIYEIPWLVNEVSRGNTNKIAVELQQYGIMPAEVAELSLGLEVNAVCEGLHTNFWQATPASRNVDPVVLEAIVAEWRVYEQLCPVWTGRQLGMPAGQALTSEVPLIIFQGEFTPGYSPEIVDELLRGMKNARHIVAPNVSNDAFSGENCAGQLLYDWLQEPGRDQDTSCMNNTEPLTFRMPDQ